MKADKVIEALQSDLDYEVIVCPLFEAIPQAGTALTVGINTDHASKTHIITVEVSPRTQDVTEDYGKQVEYARAEKEKDQALAKWGRFYRNIRIRP